MNIFTITITLESKGNKLDVISSISFKIWFITVKFFVQYFDSKPKMPFKFVTLLRNKGKFYYEYYTNI